jgi:hypothetical protein
MAAKKQQSIKQSKLQPPIKGPTGGKPVSTKGRTESEATEKSRPFVKPGQSLRYVEKLNERASWPPLRGKERPGREKRPTITPYIVVAAFPGENGSRPIGDQQALYNASVQIIDTVGASVLAPVKGSTYFLRCSVANLGGAGAFGGMAEFYVAPPSVLDNAAATIGAILPAKGYSGFSAMPGSTVTFQCPNSWTPISDAEAASSIVVQAYDAFVGRVVRGFGARQDRHVGRRDYIPDFNGVWDGTESANIIHGTPTLIRIVITQNYLDVNAAIYMQLGGGIPPTPQDTTSGTILGGQVQLSSTEYWGPSHEPFTSNQWTLSIRPGGLLHFEHHRHYLIPGDGRPDLNTSGDLHRI